MGKFPLSTYRGALSFCTTPLSGSHSFFTPLEIVLLTWVDNSFFVFPRLFTLCLCTTGLASFKRKAVYLRRVNIWERAFCCLFERAASNLTIGSIPIGTNSGLCTFTDSISEQIGMLQHSSHTNTCGERSTLLLLCLSVCQCGQQSSTSGDRNPTIHLF